MPDEATSFNRGPAPQSFRLTARFSAFEFPLSSVAVIVMLGIRPGTSLHGAPRTSR
jgi:hypothetical protein